MSNEIHGLDITVTIQSDDYPLSKTFTRKVKVLSVQQAAESIYAWFAELNGMGSPFDLNVLIEVDCEGESGEAWGKSGLEIADEILNIVENMQDRYKTLSVEILEQFHHDFQRHCEKYRTQA